MPEFLTRTAGRFPDRTALVFMGKKIAYRELEAQVNRFSRALRALGVQAGDRVALLLPNMPQLVVAHYAALRIGAVPAPHDPLLPEEALAGRINASGANVLVTLDLRLPVALEIKPRTSLRAIVACHITDYLPFPGNRVLRYIHPNLYQKVPPGEGMYEFLPLLNAHSDAPLENAARWEGQGALLYRGNAADSRAVLLTHANLSCSCQQLRAFLPGARDGGESILAVFPFFQAAGWTGMQNLSILAGWTGILVPRPDPQVVVEILKKFRPTILPGPPAVLGALLAEEAFRRTDFSALKAFWVGGASLPQGQIEELQALGNCPVLSFYGLTETSGTATATPWGSTGRPGTVGVPLPDTDLKIVAPAPAGGELPAGQAGEIWLKGPQVTPGDGDGVRDTPAFPGEGWFRTGDTGFLDDEGYLTITGQREVPHGRS
jgi:long-chain acyl-CoA synthetase